MAEPLRFGPFEIIPDERVPDRSFVLVLPPPANPNDDPGVEKRVFMIKVDQAGDVQIEKEEEA